MDEDEELYDTPHLFEGMSQENGEPFWWQSDLQELLGYKTSKSFDNAVGRAMQALTALGVSVPDNFRHAKRETGDGKLVDDCKLSRFACYLTALNGDTKKPEVARAQAYFATLAEIARQYHLQAEKVERVLIRDEISEQNDALAGTAKAAGVQNYAYFQSAGYRGLYNMTLPQLKKLKGVPKKKTVLDFMGREELAANLFRITQTEAKIRNDGVQGQKPLERTAEGVGKQVRKAIRDIGGTMPERLAPEDDISKAKSEIRKVGREFKKLDKGK